MTLFDQISEDIKSAMKARDKVRLETLRNIKKLMVLALLMSMVSTKMMAYDAKIKGLYYSFSGTEAEYDATLCTETPDAYDSNMLKGVTAATDIAETDGEYTNFIFNIVDDKIGFYPANAGTIPAYQAYLQIPTASLPTSTPARLEIVFEDGDLSNVKQVKTNTLTDGNWYMLDGALTLKPSKKGVYIYNGKRVIIK